MCLNHNFQPSKAFQPCFNSQGLLKFSSSITCHAPETPQSPALFALPLSQPPSRLFMAANNPMLPIHGAITCAGSLHPTMGLHEDIH